MKKFIFGFMAVALMSVFASCNGKSATCNVEENDSTAVDTVLVDSVVVDSAVVDSATVLN